METLGGGQVLEPDAPRYRTINRASELAASRGLSSTSLANALHAFLDSRAAFGLSLQYVAQCFGIPATRVVELLKDSNPVITHDSIILTRHFDSCKTAILFEIDAIHKSHPEQQGISPSEFRGGQVRRFADPILQYAVDTLVNEGALTKRAGVLSRADRHFTLTDRQQAAINSISAILKRNDFSPPLAGPIAEELAIPKQEIEKSLVLMERMGVVRRLGVDLFFDSVCFDNAIMKIQDALIASKGLSVADISKLLASSRKYVVPFLEYLDKEGVTVRNDNLRVKGPKLIKRV